MCLKMLAGGMTPEQVLQDFPYLEKADIDASLEYAARHAAHREILLSKWSFLSTWIFRRACVFGWDRIVTKPNIFLITIF
jgi:Protein of unknown function (DUF433)